MGNIIYGVFSFMIANSNKEPCDECSDNVFYDEKDLQRIYPYSEIFMNNIEYLCETVDIFTKKKNKENKILRCKRYINNYIIYKTGKSRIYDNVDFVYLLYDLNSKIKKYININFDYPYWINNIIY